MRAVPAKIDREAGMLDRSYSHFAEPIIHMGGDIVLFQAVQGQS
jgi:hypothetical protein